MGWNKGFNFRSTAAFVTDPVNSTYVLSTNITLQSRNGANFLWSTAGSIDLRDRTAVGDTRLSGINFVTNGGANAVWMLFLPTIGDYDVYLAAGDQAGSQTINVQVLDAATAFITITNVLTGAADSYVDASGATRTRAQWIADSAFGGTKVTRTFAGTVLNINLNAPSADSSCIAHLFLAQRTTSAVCDTSAFPKPFMRTPQLAGRFI